MEASAFASSSEGKTEWIMVARSGYQVFIHLDNPPVGKPACSTHAVYDYAFSLNEAGAAEQYAALLTAHASGRDIYILGTGQCTVSPDIEDVSYFVLK